MAIEAHATARFVRTSAQKAGLVMDLIRGRDVNRALATLQFTRKGISHDISKLLRSANQRDFHVLLNPSRNPYG